MSEWCDGVCALQYIGGLSRVYSCLSPNACWVNGYKQWTDG
uniref:Uncharacterized protein n=1 Tax=Anguilla anguilla TaxID=7936 RepID=A0A0E9XUI6_ANGAN